MPATRVESSQFFTSGQKSKKAGKKSNKPNPPENVPSGHFQGTHDTRRATLRKTFGNTNYVYLVEVILLEATQFYSLERQLDSSDEGSLVKTTKILSQNGNMYLII